ncbi:arginase [Paracoccus sp. SM22M-07]|uniref:arginase n=1 Tax=Paracoccus sp. SM22M-07 TaxID=1520813 RepID=UPI0009318357|nr:arginase [Paracoccus sp. SM22M-07]
MTRPVLIGAPVDSGQRQPGCLMGPAAYRVAGIGGLLQFLGLSVTDRGDLALPAMLPETDCANPAVDQLATTLVWTALIRDAVGRTLDQGGMPVVLRGDHALALGSVAGAADHAARAGQPLFLLWLDAHSDFHTHLSTTSGNLHGTPVAYAAGCAGFDGFPPFPAPIPADHICLFGIRSVDPAERRALDERGITPPLTVFLHRVRGADGMMHVSLDVDFLDPAIAPAVGTTVPGSATFREAHLTCELIHETGLMTSLDLVELNPFLDDRGRSAKLMVDLTGSLMGRKVFDRPTRSFI